MSQSFSSTFSSFSSRPRAAALAATFAVLLFAGCATENLNEEVVQFVTTPPGATVKIDGTPVGHTPMSAVLGRQRETNITLEKTAFVTVNIHVHPVDGDLTPNPVTAALRSELLPSAPGPDPQAELAKSLEVVRQYAEMGRISQDDRAYIDAQLKDFYAAPPAPAKP
jgi:hypothetical protein